MVSRDTTPLRAARQVNAVVRRIRTIAGATLKWDYDKLDYGYVLHRLPDGAWWHLHFARSGLEYDCQLLRGATLVLAAVQCFAAGVLAVSEQFVLTLDGEGVELPDEALLLDFDWGCKPDDSKLQADARAFQQNVMPLLHDSRDFQKAVWEIVDRQQHLRMVASDKLEPRATSAK